VAEPPEEDRDRQAREACVEGPEGVERLELDLERQRVVAEAQLGDRVGAGEGGLAQPRQATDEAGREPVTVDERRQELALEDARDGRPGLPARGRGPAPEGEEGEGQVATLGGPVEQLPVAELAAAAERDRAGADPTEREGDFPECRAGE